MFPNKECRAHYRTLNEDGGVSEIKNYILRYPVEMVLVWKRSELLLLQIISWAQNVLNSRKLALINRQVRIHISSYLINNLLVKSICVSIVGRYDMVSGSLQYF